MSTFVSVVFALTNKKPEGEDNRHFNGHSLTERGWSPPGSSVPKGISSTIWDPALEMGARRHRNAINKQINFFIKKWFLMKVRVAL
jgi:hypothetical protein